MRSVATKKKTANGYHYISATKYSCAIVFSSNLSLSNFAHHFGTTLWSARTIRNVILSQFDLLSCIHCIFCVKQSPLLLLPSSTKVSQHRHKQCRQEHGHVRFHCVAKENSFFRPHFAELAHKLHSV